MSPSSLCREEGEGLWIPEAVNVFTCLEFPIGWIIFQKWKAGT
jgi:hypothetical protein